MTAAHATAAPADTPDTAARKALFASAIGYAMDGFDLLILGFMLRAISADLRPDARRRPARWSPGRWSARSPAASCSACSADYYGRVRVLTWTILLFAVFTGLCAFAQGYWDLLVYRTIAGLGLGGEFGIGMALVAEAWPAKQARARLAPMSALGWQAGVLCAALRDAAAAAVDRLARHVPRRAHSRRRRLRGALVCRRAEDLRRPRGAGRAPMAPLAHAGEGHGDHARSASACSSSARCRTSATTA